MDTLLYSVTNHSNTSSLETLDMLSAYCSEFLVHAADVEGLCQGIDQELVKSASMQEPCQIYPTFSFGTLELGEWVTIPTTYAGGAKGMY